MQPTYQKYCGFAAVVVFFPVVKNNTKYFYFSLFVGIKTQHTYRPTDKIQSHVTTNYKPTFFFTEWLSYTHLTLTQQHFFKVQQKYSIQGSAKVMRLNLLSTLQAWGQLAGYSNTDCSDPSVITSWYNLSLPIIYEVLFSIRFFISKR